MKRVLCMFLAALMLFSLCGCGGAADKGKGNKAEGDGWKITAEGVLVVSKLDKHAKFSNSDPAPWFLYRMLFHSIVIEEGITHIPAYAFKSSEKAESIQLPESLEQIADHAFSSCLALKSIEIPKNVNYIGREVFLNCPALETVVWGTVNVSERCFAGCSSLKNVELPEGVRSIDRSAFSNCVSLETLILPTSLRTFEDDSFEGCTSLVLQLTEGSDAEKMAQKHQTPYTLIGE